MHIRSKLCFKFGLALPQASHVLCARVLGMLGTGGEPQGGSKQRNGHFSLHPAAPPSLSHMQQAMCDVQHYYKTCCSLCDFVQLLANDHI